METYWDRHAWIKLNMIKGTPASEGVNIFQNTSICCLGNGFVTLHVISKEKEIRKASIVRNIIDEDYEQHGSQYTPLWNTR